MKLQLLASAALVLLSAVVPGAAEERFSVESLASEDLSSEDLSSPDGFEFEEQKSCRDRWSRDWCLNNFQPRGGCEWDGRNGRCSDRKSGGGGGGGDRMRCSGRTGKTWCTNDFQPSSGDCEWKGNTRNGFCRTAPKDDRMRCSGRTTRTWCTNDFQPRSGRCEWRGGRCREESRGPPPKRDSKSKKKADCSGRGRKSCMDKKGCEYVSRKRGNSFCRSSKKDEDSSDYDFESASEDYLAVE